MDVVLELASPPPESGRSSPSPTASPEFEFWMVGKNPGSFPSPALLTADELFSDGIVLPLHTLQAPSPNGDQEEDAEEDDQADGEEDTKESSEPVEGEEFPAQPLAESCTIPAPDLPAVTFKWKDIFKTAGEHKDRSSKKAERRVSSVSGNSELININIWPFSRSRSAGHSAAPAAGAGAISKAKANNNPSASNAGAVAASAPASSAAPVGRKVSSAPCSRSNSRGETSGPAAPTIAIAVAAEKAAAQAGALPGTSMLRRWVPGGQGRTGAGASGIRLGRASPVWQLRRNKLQQAAAAAEQKQKDSTKTNNKPVPDDVVATSQANPTEVLEDKDAPAPAPAASVSVPTAPCRKNAACSEADVEECHPPHGLFGLRRTFFSKKVY